METLKKILFFLNSNERKRAAMLMVMIILMALLDMVGVASVVPFIAVLTNPEIIETNNILNNIYIYSANFGVKNKDEFLFGLGIFAFLLLVISISFKAFTNYVQLRFITMREYSIGELLVERYLHQPYSWFLNQHSADLGKSILSEVGKVVGSAIKPMIDLIAQTTVAITFLTLLILNDPKLAITVGLTLSASYALIYKFNRNFINRLGQEHLKANEMRYTAVSDAFSAAKEIKIGGLEQPYIKRFSDPAKMYASHEASLVVLKQLPRYALEIIVFGGMLLLILYLMARSGNFINSLPILALYTVAGYRLMPTLQTIYISITALRFAKPSLDKLYNDLKSLRLNDQKMKSKNILLKKDITLNNIQYKYPNTSKMALKDINLSIAVHSVVGVVGVTGSGKTTMVDVILGLLEPQTGKLKVDGNPINKENLRSWQNSIGYVPQQIYLADETVAANIAFGVRTEDINHEEVERAAKIANIHEFVINELPKEYETTVGERGVRLSGGQRQRIGIARALYHNPQLLVLDEGTSALDNLTEHAVMETLNGLKKEITIILIAHRLNTVKNCDNIFFLKNGKLNDEGSFDKLIKNNRSFREIAE